MSTYTVDFSKLTGKDKVDAAIKEVRSYLGDQEAWDKTYGAVAISLAEGYNFAHIRLILSFVGIQGYPVEAMVHYVRNMFEYLPVPEGMDE